MRTDRRQFAAYGAKTPEIIPKRVLAPFQEGEPPPETQSPATVNGRALEEGDLVGADRHDDTASDPRPQSETAIAAAMRAALARKAVRA